MSYFKGTIGIMGMTKNLLCRRENVLSTTDCFNRVIPAVSENRLIQYSFSKTRKNGAFMFVIRFTAIVESLNQLNYLFVQLR